MDVGGQSREVCAGAMLSDMRGPGIPNDLRPVRWTPAAMARCDSRCELTGGVTCRSITQFFGTTLILSVVLWQLCEGADFGVGGDGIWALGDPSYYQAWANGVQFQLGDTIGECFQNS